MPENEEIFSDFSRKEADQPDESVGQTPDESAGPLFDETGTEKDDATGAQADDKAGTEPGMATGTSTAGTEPDEAAEPQTDYSAATDPGKAAEAKIRDALGEDRTTETKTDDTTGVNVTGTRTSGKTGANATGAKTDDTAGTESAEVIMPHGSGRKSGKGKAALRKNGDRNEKTQNTAANGKNEEPRNPGDADDGNKDASAPKDRIRRVPPFSIAMFALTGVCAILYLIQRLSTGFSDFFNENISAFFRRILAYVTCWFPFSLSEVLLILLPVAAVLIVVFVIRKKCETWRDIGRFCLILLSVVALLFNLFVLNFSAGYYGTTLDKKLGLDRSPEKPEELYRTALILIEEANRACAELDYDGNGSSEMPYSVGEMNRLLMEAYAKASEKYDFIDHFYSRVKPVMLSEPMSYTHITVHFPDYCTPFTAAHELAHQRGIAREDEANFVAFLVCIESEDAYIRYSGYLNLYEYVMSALSSADGKLYREAYGRTSAEVRGELRAYSEFYEKYRDNVAADISGAVNNSYLQSQGTVGERSYGLVVDLAVAYYRK